MTETELILSLCEEKDVGIEGSTEELIQKFRETYKDQADLITEDNFQKTSRLTGK